MLDSELLKKFTKKFKKGDILCLEHDIGKEIYYIVNGRVKITKIYKKK